MTETVRPELSRMYRWLVLIFVSLAMLAFTTATAKGAA